MRSADVRPSTTLPPPSARLISTSARTPRVPHALIVCHPCESVAAPSPLPSPRSPLPSTRSLLLPPLTALSRVIAVFLSQSAAHSTGTSSSCLVLSLFLCASDVCWQFVPIVVWQSKETCVYYRMSFVDTSVFKWQVSNKSFLPFNVRIIIISYLPDCYRRIYFWEISLFHKFIVNVGPSER